MGASVDIEGMGPSGSNTSKFFSVAMIAVLLTGFVVAAVRADGNHATQVDLNDAGIWVSKGDTREIGRLNAELELVDAKLIIPSPDFELLQWGSTVLVRADDRLFSVDVRIPQTNNPVDLPLGSQLVLGGSTAAVFNPVGGSLWIGNGRTIGTTEFDETEPTMNVDGVDEVIAGIDGSLYAFRRSTGTVSRVELGQEELTIMEVGEVSASSTITLVGTQPVILDGATLLFNDNSVDLRQYGETFFLQDPGPQAAGAVFATGSSLVSVDFEEAVATVLADVGTGAPVTPVVVNGCSYGAWQAEPTMVAHCGGEDGLRVHPVPQTPDDTPMKFRVNHNRVTLNVLPNGAAFLMTDGEPAFVTDWSQALHDEPDEGDEENSQTDDQVEAFQPVCDRTENVAPDAQDDSVVTRVGRPIIIRPLSNDSDANCDVLTIQLGELPDGIGRVDLIEGNRAIQYSPADDQSTRVTIPYRASDGVESDSAVITVEFEPIESAGSAPIAVEDRTFVAQGGTVTHNVLVNDRDPDGDSLAVESIGEPDGGSARFRPDGQIVYSAPGDKLGNVTIPYVLIDETGLTDEGTLVIEVKAATTNTLPIARSDHGVGFVGDEIVVDLLANDTDADGDDLIVAGVEQQAGLTLDHAAGLVTFTSEEPQTVRLVYEISDGRSGETVEGSLRFDVLERSAENQAPIAVRDDVVAIPGVPLVVDVLTNDFEPDGDVVVVTAVADVPKDLTVEILERSLLRVTVNSSDMTDTYQFRYQVSDGFHGATGLVVVRPILVGGDNQAPVLQFDTAEVHAGGAITIPVLENDFDPDGDILVLEAAVVREPQGMGLFVVQGEALRFLAPADSKGTVTGTYTVFDGFNRVSETVKIRVKEATADNNLAPRPPDVEARTFAGQEVRIALPLDRMDPDGDPVEILGLSADLADLPRLGAVTRIAADAIYYQPFDGYAGTDRFRYKVRDSFGAEGTGLIEVGIVPLPDVNGSPVAVGDTYSVETGATAMLRPLLNDSDPEGEPITIIAEGFTPPSRGIAEVTDDGLGIRFTAPQNEDVIIFGYTIADPAGARASATIEVTVSGDAENLPPIAFDDVLGSVPEGTEVVVPVLDNDIDPDGEVLDLDLSVIGFDAATIGADKTISFVMPGRSVSFAYTISDPLEPTLASTAFVQVPLAFNRPPFIESLEQTIPYNETTPFNILGLVSDPDGDEVFIVPDSISVLRGSGTFTFDRGVVTFDPGDRFSGQGGFTFRASDGELETVGVVNIIVEASGNETPSFRTAQLEVPAAGSRTFELQANVVDPDDQQHRFLNLDRSQLPSGIDVSLTESGRLSVSAPAPDSRGTTGSISFGIDDGKEFGEASGTVRIEVIGSDKPLPEARPDTPATDPRLGDLRSGQTNVELHVLDNDFDPFQDGSLVISAYGPVVPPEAGVLPSAAGDPRTIVFTPAEGFFGTATIPYSVMDATADLDRVSSSTVTVSIKDIPGAPPSIIGVPASHQITLDWDPAEARGGEIDRYEVVHAATEAPACESNSTICTVAGLTNGTNYQFKVRAVNEVGAGPWSNATPDIRPNARPDAPDAPTVTFGDGELTVQWQPPNNEGSPIESYVLRIYPSLQTYVTGANTFTHSWTGLTNGENYWFDVQATNVDFDSDWSGTSAVEHPTGIPLNVPAPNPPNGGDQIVDVTWDAPFENGGTIQAYQLEVYRDNVRVDTVNILDPDNRSYRVQNATNGSTYSFAVLAQNRAGWSASSSRSANTVPSGVPFGVATTSNQPGSSVVTWNAPNDNGAVITEYQVALQTSTTPPSSGNWMGGFSPSTRSTDILTLSGTAPPGTQYYVWVSACNVNGCSQDVGRMAPVNYCWSPNIWVTSSVNDRTITWTWGEGVPSGRPIVSWQLSGVASGSGAAMSHTQTFSQYDTQYTLTVTGTSSCELPGENSDTQSSTARTAPPPPPPYYTVRTANWRSCPQDQFNTSYFDAGPPATCDVSWIQANININVVCKFDAPGGWAPDGEIYWLDQYNSPWHVHAYGINYSSVPTCP